MNLKVFCMVAFAVLVLSSGYGQRQQSATPEPSPNVQAVDFAGGVRHDVSEWTREGLCTTRKGPPRAGYIFYLQLRTPLGEEPTIRYAVLKEGYGMLIRCDGYSPKRKYPIPHFDLFSANRGIIVRTTDRAAVKHAVSQIPARDTLRDFNTCGGGLSHGMDPNVMEEIIDVCKQKGIKYVSSLDGGTICTCF
jgi:hypothetical protein